MEGIRIGSHHQLLEVMNEKKKDKKGGWLPSGGEEERRGNSRPTHPDLMGPFPNTSAQGTVLDKEEQAQRDQEEKRKGKE